MRAVLVGVLVLSLAAPAGAGPSKQPGQGWGPYAVKGTITAIDPAGMTLTVQVESALPSRGNPNPPGQRQKISAAPGTSVVVRVVTGQTLIGVGRRNALPFSAFQAGDRVQLWGGALADDTVAAVRIQLLGRAHGPVPAGTAPPGPPLGASGIVHGVVVGMGAALTVITDAGTVRTVTVTAATVVSEHGKVAGPGALHLYDIVQATGTAAGGALAASAIGVEFDSSTGVQVTAPIGLTVPAVEGITVGGTIVGVHPEAFIIQGPVRLPFTALTPGRTVTVYGTPVSLGPVPFGMQARVVVVAR